MTNQAAREEQMLRRGRERAETIEKDRGLAYSPHGRHFVAQATRELEEWLDERRTWLQAERYSPHISEHDIRFYDAVEPLDSGTLAFCVVNCLMGLLMRGQTSPDQVTYAIGRDVETEILIRAARKKEPTVWDQVKHRWRRHKKSRRVREARRAFVRNGVELDLFDYETRTIVGTFLAQATQSHTGIFQFSYERIAPGSRDRAAKVTLTPEAAEWLERSKEAYSDFSPRWLSCIEPPLPWTNRWDGGFKNDALARSIMVTREVYAAKAYADRPLGKVPQAVNVLQETAYAIDPKVYEVYSFCVENDKAWGGLVQPKARELPPEFGDKGSEQWKVSRRARGQVWRLNEDQKAQRYVQFFVRRQAEEDLNQKLYFVHQIDTRGRMYPVGEFLNPQGSDYQRSLLRFHEGQVIEDEEAMDWLRIAGANAAGQDKASFEERIQWVKDNQAMIEAAAEDPYSVHEWRTADKPWTFLAFCFDYVSALRGDPSHFPVAQDGTCNGLQLWSLLLRDEQLGRWTNLVPAERPDDIYGQVADRFTQRLKDYSGEDSEAVDWWLRIIRLLGGSLPRAFAKRPTMTKPYSVTKYAVQDHLKDALDQAFPSGREGRDLVYGRGLRRRLRVGADILWEVMSETLRAAHEGMVWIQQSADIITASGESPSWFTPSGLWVSGAVRKKQKVKIELAFGEKTWRRAPYRTKNQIARNKVQQSIAPNYIHSLDAAVAALLILRMKELGVESFRSIHDSFAVHANSAALLSQQIREILVEVFQEDQLKNLRDYWTEQFKVELPPLPEYGSLEISDVRGAQYAFS